MEKDVTKPDALASLEKLEQAATAGPWVVGGSNCGWMLGMFKTHPNDDISDLDAKFIAAFRNAAPALIAVARAAHDLMNLNESEGSVTAQVLRDEIREALKALEGET